MGGALSIASGVLVPEVDAVVTFYGTPSSELADPSKAKAPIQAHFGEHDSFLGFSDVTVRPSFTRYLFRLFRCYDIWRIHNLTFLFIFSTHAFHCLILLVCPYCNLY